LSSKACTYCEELKDLDEFNLNNVAKDGRTSRCTECLRLYKKEWYKKHGKEEYIRNKIPRAIIAHKWRKKNPNYMREWRAKNPDYDRLWYEDNKDKCAKNTKKWYEANKHKSHASAAAYRARKLNSIEKLTQLERLKIKKIYEECGRMNADNKDIKYHVDHIIPLSKGGLHHPDNLQILKAVDNLRKRCKLPY